MQKQISRGDYQYDNNNNVVINGHFSKQIHYKQFSLFERKYFTRQNIRKWIQYNEENRISQCYMKLFPHNGL